MVVALVALGVVTALSPAYGPDVYKESVVMLDDGGPVASKGGVVTSSTTNPMFDGNREKAEVAKKVEYAAEVAALPDDETTRSLTNEQKSELFKVIMDYKASKVKEMKQEIKKLKSRAKMLAENLESIETPKQALNRMMNKIGRHVDAGNMLGEAQQAAAQPRTPVNMMIELGEGVANKADPLVAEIQHEENMAWKIHERDVEELKKIQAALEKAQVERSYRSAARPTVAAPSPAMNAMSPAEKLRKLRDYEEALASVKAEEKVVKREKARSEYNMKELEISEKNLIGHEASVEAPMAAFPPAADHKKIKTGFSTTEHEHDVELREGTVLEKAQSAPTPPVVSSGKKDMNGGSKMIKSKNVIVFAKTAAKLIADEVKKTKEPSSEVKLFAIAANKLVLEEGEKVQGLRSRCG